MADTISNPAFGPLAEALFLPDAEAAGEAQDLIARFGVHARSEAAARANRCRELGNIVHFCRWRQIGRLIAWCEAGPAQSTIH